MRGSIASGGGSGLFLSGVVKLSQLRMKPFKLKSRWVVMANGD